MHVHVLLLLITSDPLKPTGNILQVMLYDEVEKGKVKDNSIEDKITLNCEEKNDDLENTDGNSAISQSGRIRIHLNNNYKICYTIEIT